MKIMSNKWYRFECQAAREQWLERVLKISSNITVAEQCLHASALKYNTRTYSINYRTKIREDYYHLYELYTWTSDNKYNKDVEENMGPDITDISVDNTPKYNKEMEEKMRLGIIGAPINGTSYNNPLIDNYVNKIITQLRNKYDAEKDKVIEASLVGKAARNYLNTLISQQQPFEIQPEFSSLVPFSSLSDAEQRRINYLAEQEDKEITELKARMRELQYLISIADTYEQKEKLFKKYGILTSEVKTTTDKIKKSK